MEIMGAPIRDYYTPIHLSVPRGTRILGVGVEGVLRVYLEYDPDLPKTETITISAWRTGAALNTEGLKYIGMIQDSFHGPSFIFQHTIQKGGQPAD